jgi:hypothetical protein
MNDKTTYIGIDYAFGMANIDSETGIRYGVIHQNQVLQAWADSSEPEYACNGCDVEQGSEDCSMAACEPVGFVYDADGYLASADSMGDIMILKSPYFTYAQFCSPCAPGACHLENPLEHRDAIDGATRLGNNQTYCFGHDWFDDNEAPYPVYEVATGKLVKP